MGDEGDAVDDRGGAQSGPLRRVITRGPCPRTQVRSPGPISASTSAGDRLRPDRGDVEQVVPPAGQAHLDRVAAQSGEALGQAAQLTAIGHDPAAGRHAWAEHEPGQPQLVLRADGAVVTGPLRAVPSHPQQFVLGIAHVAAIELAGPIPVQQPPSREPIVD